MSFRETGEKSTIWHGTCSNRRVEGQDVLLNPFRSQGGKHYARHRSHPVRLETWETGYETDSYEFEGDSTFEGPFNEVEEMELASELARDHE